jgi:hypothetical protein
VGSEVATACAHEDSRLTCIECEAPICSNCLVQCPVGFRCPKCNGTENKVAKTSPRSAPKSVDAPPMLVAGTLGLCILIGFCAGWIIPFINIPFLDIVVCFLLGLVTGKWLAKIIDDRLGHKVGTIIVFGILIGMSLSPYGALPVLMFESIAHSVSGGGSSLFGAINNVLGSLFSPIGFIVGVLRPTVWDKRW